MKRLTPILVVLLFGLWIGCGDEENGPTNGDGKVTPKLFADTSVSEPELTSPDEAVWSDVDSVIVPVLGENRPKLRPSDAAAVPPEVMVKAIKKGGKLYLRMQWSDLTFDAYPDHFEVEEIDIISVPLTVRFIQKEHGLTEEDQVFVMFDSLPQGGYDVWNWRVLTTGGAGLGKGHTYTIEDIAPIEDAVGTASDSVAVKNPMAPPSIFPTYAHKNTSQFDDYIFYIDDTVHYQKVLDSIYDEVQQKWLDVYFYNTTGWSIDQKVPGWLIDSSFVSLPDAARGSRWDIRAVSDYDNDVSEYHVVLCRELNTTFPDDMDLSAFDSVKVTIGFFNGQEDFTPSSNSGFSDDFWIMLK